jgi:hypothetical protein
MPVLVTANAFDNSLDLVTNNSGIASVANLDLFLQANGIEDWTADLVSGAIYSIPDTLETNINRLNEIKANVVCSPFDKKNFDDAEAFFNALNDNWILTGGTWHGQYTWKANGIWQTV